MCITQLLYKSCSTSLHTKWSCKTRTSEPLMVAKKLDSAEPNPRRRMKKIGLRCKFLNRPLHGGGFSTCPLKFQSRCGSNHIVFLHCWEEQYYFQSYNILMLMIRFVNISLLCRITWKSTLRYNHILYTTNHIFWYKVNSLYAPFYNTTINPL